MPPLILESFEELRNFLGQEIAKSDWIAISQDRIQAFAEITGDHQWIHLDSERAKRESPYRSTIAHGFLTLSLISQLFATAVRISSGRLTINYGLNRVRFPAPVPAGALLRASFTVQSFRELAKGSEVTLLVAVESENAAKPCCVAEWILRHS
jgi:acyl dehydratase